MTTRPGTPVESPPRLPRPCVRTMAAVPLALVLALLPSTAGAQTGQTSKTSKTSKTGKTGKTGINRNFVDAGEAAKRQEAHNDFFLSSAAGQPAQILDLQTSPYALAERPDGLDYQVFSAIGYGVATSMKRAS